LIGSNDVFTRESIKGTLENFKGDKAETVKNLLFKICKCVYEYHLSQNKCKARARST